MTKGPVIVYRPGIEEIGGKGSHGFQGEWRGDQSSLTPPPLLNSTRAIDNDCPLINQETKEIETSVFLIHGVTVTMTTHPFACIRKNTFYASHLLQKHFDPHTRLLRKGDKKANASCLDLTYEPDTSMGIYDSSTIYGEAE